MGPTASGKTPLALALARVLPVEIVSVDSAQVYRGMDVGTAKPLASEREGVPHHLVDIIDPTEAYSAARFRADALKLMREITARARIPVLAGGTMLYFKALREGLSELPGGDEGIRAQIDAEAAAKLQEKYRAEADRYRDDQKELDTKARELAQEADLAHHKTDRFDLGEVFLEIALVVTSITLLSGRRFFWYLGLLFGSGGVLVAVSALLVK